VQGLVADGLVERIPSATDKRMVTLTLTDAGQDLATRVGRLENKFHEANAGLVRDADASAIFRLLWQYVEGKPAGMALARRTGRETGVPRKTEGETHTR
jgi:MarR family transcriptional regulator, organic hydroperoxide resistance regulator